MGGFDCHCSGVHDILRYHRDSLAHLSLAQAFHWCPDHESALKEFARVLKPDGVVVLTWNLEDR